MSLPVFELDTIADNSGGWGPRSNNDECNLPFQQFNKADRIGRVADWIGVDRYFRRGTDRYNERLYGSAANAGSQFDYVHEMDENNFQLVDSSKPIQRPAQRNFKTRQLQFKKLLQKEQERKEMSQHMQSQKMKRSIAKEHQRAYKQWQRRGGANRAAGPRQGRFGPDRPKDRLPSVIVRPEWDVLEEMDFPRLGKLNLPGITQTGQDIGDHQYGTLNFYDKTIDRVSVKNPVVLQRCGGSFYSISTTDDPVMEKLAQESAGNVFATDIILATLMTAARSVYSWDIVAHRVGNKLFFDRRETGGFSNPVDALTVSETSADPPSNDPSQINNVKDLATEALYINQNFRRQVLRRDGETYKFKHAQFPFEEDGEPNDAGCAYKYRRFNLGNGSDGTPLDVVVRTEHDGVMVGVNGDVQTITIKAFNEWDSSQSNGVDWRSKLDSQKGAVLATELKNNSCKLAKWTVQAVLAGSDAIKFGYVSRLSPKNSAQHLILGTQQLRPMEFAQNIGLNFDNCWGILRVIVDSLMKRQPGKYLLMKDPQAPIVRLYSLPEGTFESDEESEESAPSDDDN